ncbi:ModD protein [Acerihabitans arboris]|uniref:Putative pyrophosphorylase ModD n=1 Tax=Acerihabitans arboris TaxID=2691583 RepID=A0A845SQ15_9GAMM|nr:ModD protein [Acerihabitans arboris]NDL64648.1 ModD protein [Acerihabitans arboris]
MLFLSDQELDSLLLEDIRYGDLTTRALGIGARRGVMTFSRRTTGKVSGLDAAARVLQRLGLSVAVAGADGQVAPAGDPLLTAAGPADRLHQGWKVAQNLLEWCSGVAQATHDLVALAQSINPRMQIACTRKTIPGTKTLALGAVIDGGGTLHRCGTADTVLLFANHRHFCADPADWRQHVATLRLSAPDRLIVVEADNETEAMAAIDAGPDLVQLDKFSPGAVSRALAYAKTQAPACRLAVAGGINTGNIGEYARTGIELAVTSMPYYSPPADISVRLHPVP